MRARFAKEIVAEFMVPARRLHKNTSQKVAIFAPGMPGAPSRGSLLEFFARKGFWAITLRYRGTWESGGTFLKISPEKDVRAIMDQLPRGFKDIYSEKVFRVRKPEIYLIGSSFGGPAALLNSRDRRVKKVLCISPVVDWRTPSKKEPLDWLERFVRGAFGEAYRFSHANWKKLSSGKFYNPIGNLRAIDGNKVMIIRAKDDGVVSPRSVKKFAEASGAHLMWRPRGGHLSASVIMRPAVWKKVWRFLAK